MVIAPRVVLRSVVSGGPRGIRDLLFLLALQLVATQTPRLWSAVLYTVQVSYGSGMSVLLNTIAESLVVPVVAVLATALLLGPLTQGCARRERNLDLVALSMLPMVCLELAATLVFASLGAQPARWVALSVLASGAVWFLALASLSFSGRVLW